MDILRLEIRGPENIILTASVAASLLIWGWTLWKNQIGCPEENSLVTINAIRSPGSPRTRSAFKEKGCTCKMISTLDDCTQNKVRNEWNSSDEEEIDTDVNLIPSSMRSTRQVMLNR
ncbi:unnamed protein product [Caenorhabditis brenneri]